MVATAVGERSLAMTYLRRLGKSDNISREHLELNVWKLFGISNGTQSSGRKRFEQCKFVGLIPNLSGVSSVTKQSILYSPPLSREDALPETHPSLEALLNHQQIHFLRLRVVFQ
jgi:hypothetical protein